MARVTFDMSKSDITDKEMSRYLPFVKAAHRQLHEANMPYSGWVDYPNNISDEMLQKIQDAADEIKATCTALVVIGIGGSYLGAKSCIEMLNDSFKPGSTKVIFAGWNLSGTYHAELVNSLADEDICVCIVSKSGTTMEPSAAFKLFKSLLKQKYGEEYYKRIYAVTDEKSGTLRAEADKYNYTSFILENDIGGRYSVLTAAGLLPIAVAGIDIYKIVEGAGWAQNEFADASIENNICYRYAVARRILNAKGKKAELFAYYEPRFEYFMEWLKQLFGESEGKEKKGMFPISAMFTRDLHSLGQFLQEGTPFFFESIFKVKNPLCDISFGKDQLSYNEMNDVVYEAVCLAHRECNTPVLNFEIEDMSEESYGYMVYFFEKACAISCILLGVDPFNQPGVEIYKKNAIDLMHKK